MTRRQTLHDRLKAEGYMNVLRRWRRELGDRLPRTAWVWADGTGKGQTEAKAKKSERKAA